MLGVTRLSADAASLLTLRRGGLGGLTMSEDGGLDEVEESFRAAASCSWRRATVASSAFNYASWASNSPLGRPTTCKRRQFGQDFRALAFMAGYATSLIELTQHR